MPTWEGHTLVSYSAGCRRCDSAFQLGGAPHPALPLHVERGLRFHSSGAPEAGAEPTADPLSCLTGQARGGAGSASNWQFPSGRPVPRLRFGPRQPGTDGNGIWAGGKWDVIATLPGPWTGCMEFVAELVCALNTSCAAFHGCRINKIRRDSPGVFVVVVVVVRRASGHHALRLLHFQSFITSTATARVSRKYCCTVLQSVPPCNRSILDPSRGRTVVAQWLPPAATAAAAAERWPTRARRPARCPSRTSSPSSSASRSSRRTSTRRPARSCRPSSRTGPSTWTTRRVRTHTGEGEN